RRRKRRVRIDVLEVKPIGEPLKKCGYRDERLTAIDFSAAPLRFHSATLLKLPIFIVLVEGEHFSEQSANIQREPRLITRLVEISSGRFGGLRLLGRLPQKCASVFKP